MPRKLRSTGHAPPPTTNSSAQQTAPLLTHRVILVPPHCQETLVHNSLDLPPTVASDHWDLVIAFGKYCLQAFLICTSKPRSRFGLPTDLSQVASGTWETPSSGLYV
ncbi:hypothetical protein HGRIS_011927 [Hohenbuehelia grisea]|uniref:Uncharacterized protein n=1 Tax=Hohenbuehelia grisea TaxID=104357 RepID=A0ABR3JY09_9AGAR